MLLLGDFIYVISSMLLKSDVDNINDYLNKRSSVCTLSHDYLANSFMSNRQEIPDSKAPDPKTCFIQLNSFNVGSFLVSASRIKYFFLQDPTQNNMFDFDIRDSVSVDYYIILSSKLYEFSTQAGLILDDLKIDYIPTMRTQYEAEPVFNRIVPSSIFSDSILLIFTSLTITSIFAIVFLLIIIYRQTKKPSPPSHKKSKKKKKYHHHQQNYDDEKVRLYEMNKQSEAAGGGGVPRFIDVEQERPRDPEIQYIHHRYPPVQQQTQNRQQQQQYQNYQQASRVQKNRTLSLSGPIQPKKFEGKPEKSWLKIDAQSSRAEGTFKFQGTSDFENQLSPVAKAEYTERSPHQMLEIAGNGARGGSENKNVIYPRKEMDIQKEKIKHDSSDPGIDLEK